MSVDTVIYNMQKRRRFVLKFKLTLDNIGQMPLKVSLLGRSVK